MPTIYLLHFDPPYKHASHYLGISSTPARRLRDHLNGNTNAHPLVRAALDAGSTVTIARLWTDATRAQERRMHRWGMNPRLCPICNPPRKGRPKEGPTP
jgi:hypothetical protein